MRIQTETILLTIGALLLFGALYATLINWMRKKGHLEGFTSFMVVGGVLMTLIINKAIHHPEPAIDLLIELACFAASGLPMIIESAFFDYSAKRADYQQRLIQTSEADNG